MGKLEKLIAELKKLPAEEPENWAEVLLLEMELIRREEPREAVDELDRLAQEALAEHRAGRTVLFDEVELDRMTAEAPARASRRERKQ